MDDTYVKFVITHRFVLKLVPTMNRSALLTGGIVTGTLPNQNVFTGRVTGTLPNQNVSTGRVTSALPKYCFTHLNEYFGLQRNGPCFFSCPSCHYYTAIPSSKPCIKCNTIVCLICRAIDLLWVCLPERETNCYC